MKKKNKTKKQQQQKKSTLKKLLIFREMELSRSKLKKFVKFQERTCKVLKSKISHFLFAMTELFRYTRKRKKKILFLIKEQNFLS